MMELSDKIQERQEIVARNQNGELVEGKGCRVMVD